MRATHNYRMEDHVIQFLISLNDNFSVVKSQVPLIDPLPSMNKVYSHVIQEESSNDVFPYSSSIDESNLLFNASYLGKTYGCGKHSPVTIMVQDITHIAIETLMIIFVDVYNFLVLSTRLNLLELRYQNFLYIRVTSQL